MLEQQDNVFTEACETLYRLNQDDKVRMWREAYEEAERVARTIERDHKREIAWRDARIADNEAKLAEREAELVEREAELAEREAEIARLERMLAEKNIQSG